MTDDDVTSVRFDRVQRQLIEARRRRLQMQNPGLRVTTSDAIRNIIANSGDVLPDGTLTASSADASQEAA